MQIIYHLVLSEYEYISEPEIDLSDTTFDWKHASKSLSPSGNASGQTDTTRKENETTEFTWSLDDENGALHQDISEEDSYPRNDGQNKTISLIPASRRQSGEIWGATGDATSGFQREGIYMGARKTNRRSEYEYGKGLMKSRRTKLTKTAEKLSSDIGDRNFPQEEKEYVTQSTHQRDEKGPPKSKKNVLHDIELHLCHPLPIHQRKTEGQSTAHDNKIQVSSVDHDKLQYLGQEEQILYPKHGQKPDAENVPHKLVFTASGADGQSKRNSYEKLNNDTMEPRDKICQCKAHPRRAKSMRYGTTCEKQREIDPVPSTWTPPVHPYMEAFCQRTAAIMIEQLRRKPKSSEHEMGNIYKIHRNVDITRGQDTAVGDSTHSSEDKISGGFAIGDSGSEDLLSSEEMRNFGRGGICHEPSRHHSQFSDISETSLCDIPTLVQYAVKQGIAEDGLEVEDGLCEWGEPNEVTDFEENLDKEYCHQHMRVKEQ